MKILYYTYPWAMDVMGGGERQLLAYQNHLEKYGIQADKYDMWNPNLSDYQIFHCFSTMPVTVAMCDYVKKRGLKLVVSPNLWITPETRGNYPLDIIWNILELADAVIVNSNMEGDALSGAFGMAREKFYTIYNGAEAEFLVPADPNLFKSKFNLERPFILNVANIEKRKNQLEFIKALRKTQPDMDLVIAGEIREHDYAKECMREGGDNLKLVGSLPYASEMLRSAHAGCAFFAMPSLLETPSIAAIEAAASGVRVLLTQEGSTREYFGDSVTYVDPNSAVSLCTGIEATLTANSTKSIWAARHNYMWPSIMPKLAQFYSKLL